MVNFTGLSVSSSSSTRLNNEEQYCYNSLTNFESIVSETELYYQDKYFRENKRYEVVKKHKYVIDPPNYNQDIPGEAKLRQFENILNAFNYERHVFQREFHDIITKALAESIVGEDWNIIGPKLMAKRDWKKRSKCAMALAPRRFGKSVSIAMTVVAYAVVRPDSVQSIFSTGRRASANLLDLCKKFAIELNLNIEKDNMEELFIKHPDGKMSKIFSYPANAKVNRKTEKNNFIYLFIYLYVVVVISFIHDDVVDVAYELHLDVFHNVLLDNLSNELHQMELL